MAITLKQRGHAGLWFMAAAVVPVLYGSRLVFSVGRAPDPLEFVIWFVVAPLLVTGMAGALLGASILNSHKVKRDWHAALRGLIVAVIAYLSYSILISVRMHSVNTYQTFMPTLLMMLGAGLLVVGWLVALAGMLAGWLLYKRQASSERV